MNNVINLNQNIFSLTHLYTTYIFTYTQSIILTSKLLLKYNQVSKSYADGTLKKLRIQNACLKLTWHLWIIIIRFLKQFSWCQQVEMQLYNMQMIAKIYNKHLI